MPSPIGHGLAGLAAGWLGARPIRPSVAALKQAALLAAVGMAPDLDLLWGRHSRETHSIGAALLVAAVAAWRRWPVGVSDRPRIFAAVAAAWYIHPVLDAFSVDNAAPVGVMLWWPFSREFVHSPHAFIDPISRNWQAADVWTHNFQAAAHEVMWLAPLALLVWWIRRR